MNEEIFNNIYELHLKNLNNKNKKSKKLIICFSGLSGSGKTTIAKKIESEFSAVRISSDEIREIIFKLGYANKFQEQHKISSKYLRWFLANYELKNKLIILDNDISRKYDDIYNILSPKDWSFFIIQIKIDPEIACKRVINRETEFEGFYDDISERIKVYEEFNIKNIANISIDNTDKFDFERVSIKIKDFLR